MTTSLTFAVPVEWDNSRTYEVNVIVFVGKKAYTALQNVPTGVDITNTGYWKETGVPYLDVSDIRSKLNELDSGFSTLESDVENAEQSIVANANNITNLTTRLNQAVSDLEDDVARVNNIMITLYTPYPES